MTVSMDKTLSPGFTVVLAEALALKEAISKLEAELRTKTDALVAMNGDRTGQVVTPVGKVTFSENNVYSEADIRSMLSPGQVKRCEVRKLDKAKVKALYPHVYATAKDTRGVKVTLG